MYHLMPVKVLKASSQVVAGIKYKLNIQVARSKCKKSAATASVDLKSCERLEGHPDQVCFSITLFYINKKGRFITRPCRSVFIRMSDENISFYAYPYVRII
ncbi:unnamed protein product [Gongylonema pulchrum]|uniref:Cystatin domain-containing protein n=1 Tax=Gongylonema pulchrum TaxID=637853 RepID=A0A183E7W5_9BILA|nr:unnamed protein product [Gongylonema pulchrum]